MAVRQVARGVDAALIVLAAALGCSPPEAPGAGDGASGLATVEGEALAAEDLRLAPNAGPEERQRALDQAILRRLAAAEARRRGLDREPELAAALRTIEREAGARKEAALQAALFASVHEGLALSEEALRAHYEAAKLRYAEGPRGIAVDGDVIAVSDTGNARVAFLRIDGSFLGELPLEEPRGIEAVSGYGFVVGSPSAGLWAALPEGDGVRARSLVLPEVAAPVDVAIAEQGVLVADAGRGAVTQLSARLGFERTLARSLGPPPRAVLGSARREVPTIYVADGERVLEIAQPVPSPLPAVESLKTRLRSGDLGGALALFEPLQRLVFAEIYEDLGAALQTDADAMGALSIDLLREDRAIVRIEAELSTGTGTELRRFPVYLVRAEDGTWQIFDY